MKTCISCGHHIRKPLNIRCHVCGEMARPWLLVTYVVIGAVVLVLLTLFVSEPPRFF